MFLLLKYTFIPINYYKCVFLSQNMDVKTKKQIYGKIARLETSGEVKEIIFKQDFMKPNESVVQVCFRGKSSSGIVELNKTELEKIYKDTIPKMNLLKNSKIMRFKK
jgi:hypothetical protein